MASKKPGVSQLGHPPMSKVKLEGPKKKHDFHGNSASVPGKGEGKSVSGDHWERPYSMSYVKDTDQYAGSDWNPKVANTRTCTHSKVNREDH